jgi:hypothetical protein
MAHPVKHLGTVEARLPPILNANRFALARWQISVIFVVRGALTLPREEQHELLPTPTLHELTQFSAVLTTVAAVTGCGVPDGVSKSLESDLSDVLETAR